jgi:geranylgeranyl diphosphate synthase, type II
MTHRPFDPASFKAAMAGLAQRIDECLPTLLPPAVAPAAVVHEAAVHALMAGGKRVRPMLVLLTCEAAGGDANSSAALAVACAWEFVHTYSLVHDDLPAMDNDELRRGQPTTWKKYDEATAILAGDALLTEAFAVVVRHAPTPEVGAALVRVLADGAGMRGMVAGQAADVAAEGQPPDADTLRFIHRHKTGALLQSAVRAGARLGGASDEKLTQLDEYGDSLGLAFQVVDDILDVTRSAEELGKTAGKDADQQKLTYPAVYGLDASRRMASDLIDRALAAVTLFGPSSSRLADMARFVLDRTH